MPGSCFVTFILTKTNYGIGSSQSNSGNSHIFGKAVVGDLERLSPSGPDGSKTTCLALIFERTSIGDDRAGVPPQLSPSAESGEVMSMETVGALSNTVNTAGAACFAPCRSVPRSAESRTGISSDC
jgi:hypothetical protein